MPAEWEPHASTWLAWPHFHGDWPGKFEPIPWVYADIVRHLSRAEEVNIIVRNAPERDTVRALLNRCHVSLKRVKFHLWPTDRGWTRDSGPVFVRRGADSLIRGQIHGPGKPRIAGLRQTETVAAIIGEGDRDLRIL